MRHVIFAWTLVGALVAAGGSVPRAHAAGEADGHGSHPAAIEVLPMEPGQGAFAAVAEIVRLLEADPDTDWSTVDLEALRQHLVDMDEVTLRAEAAERDIAGGLVATVRGRGRTLDAIRRMILAHAVELDRRADWSASAEVTQDGAELTVTSQDPGEVEHILALGFIGLMATGGHHQAHHLAIARGTPMHQGH